MIQNALSAPLPSFFYATISLFNLFIPRYLQ